MSETVPERRNKLGLALSGGGFRASLFHLGVLRRMAELDLLRYVEVLSTVSGGSIIGALYILLLKKELHEKKTLTRAEYIGIVDKLDETLRSGIQKDLRTRLFLNPFGILNILLTSNTLGKRMARIYERYLYRKIVDELGLKDERCLWSRLIHPGHIRLKDVRFTPAGEPVKEGLEAYNRRSTETKSSVVPNFILNSTSLNSGRPFRFSSVEIGDPCLGFIREDELGGLLKRKSLLQDLEVKQLQDVLNRYSTEKICVKDTKYHRKTVELAIWWLSRKEETIPARWRDIFSIDSFIEILTACEFGMLRKAKLSAWYIIRGPKMSPPVDGGLPPESHIVQFWATLSEINKEMTDRLKKSVTDVHDLMDFVLELFYLRTAEIVSPRIRKDWDRLTLGDAVGASACFPPVFPPFVELGIYDDLWVSRLCLTDGGVYDNAGITTLQEENCTYIIASDTGGLFDITQRSATDRIGMGGRIISILMNAVAELQRAGLRERRRVSRGIEKADNGDDEMIELKARFNLHGLAFFHINSSVPGLDASIDPGLTSRMRTDLDCFGDVEIAALVNHGYSMADHHIRKYLTDSSYFNQEYWQPATEQPVRIHVESEKVKTILSVGSSRFFRALKLGSGVSWLVTIAIFFSVLFIAGSRQSRLSIADVINWIASKTIDFVGHSPLFFGYNIASLAIPVVYLVALCMFIVILLFRPRSAPSLRIKKYRYPQVIRKLFFVLKWARSLMYNLLWFIGGAPLWIALVSAAIAGFYYCFYILPFKYSTKNGNS